MLTVGLSVLTFTALMSPSTFLRMSRSASDLILIVEMMLFLSAIFSVGGLSIAQGMLTGASPVHKNELVQL